MELEITQDLFLLRIGDIITKRNLYDLIQFSKIDTSSYYSGQDNMIRNTPQQGINWVGNLPDVKAVIIKTRNGSYKEDGWSDTQKNIYNYSFKASDGKISFKEKANEVLIKQQQYLYPILLFTESKSGWIFEGEFSVKTIENTYVVLVRNSEPTSYKELSQDEILYTEGERRYVTHLIIERNKDIVSILKNTTQWNCDICNLDFKEKYGVPYIEAHHKIPISNSKTKYSIIKKDLVLLCPNCHKAVHINMKLYNQEYDEIKAKLALNFINN